MRKLSPDETRNKCKIGRNEETCSFLIAGNFGFECGYVSSLRHRIVANRASMLAQAGPCADPQDTSSTAQIGTITVVSVVVETKREAKRREAKQYDAEYYRTIGKLGGNATKAKHGSAHYSTIGMGKK